MLHVSGLTKRYGHLTALADVSFTIRPAEVLGLIGPNGSGKTTLFECLGGVLPADAGTVFEDGRVLAAEDRSRRLFYLPDAIAPWPAQTVRWALTFAVGFFGSASLSPGRTGVGPGSDPGPTSFENVVRELWIINFVAAVHGGIWDRAAGYTPTAMVAEFQHGLIRLDVALIALAFIAAGLGVAALWMRLGIPVRRRLYESLALAAATAAAVFAFTFLTPSWDLSENRGNSFSRADENALRLIRTPLRIEAHLAPEDPRRFDLETRAMSKLRRAMPAVQVRYVSATSTGLFEQTSAHYGEILVRDGWTQNGEPRDDRGRRTPDGATLRAFIDGKPALDYTLGSQPGPGRNNAPPNPDLFPANNPVLRPPVAGRIGLWAKTDSTSYFKDYVMSTE